ncbi:MAG TPA: hypothetical protein PLP19_12040 [bacterium]|nr:hypothetical protein [bacterium]HPN44213.1 hypothetical protein [bacterium]
MKKLLVIVLLFLVACAERKLPTVPGNEQLPVIENFSLPEIINPGKSYLVSVRVIANPQPDYVQYTVYKEGGTEELLSGKMYDDGMAQHSTDGDIVARDGLFTQNITWQSTDENPHHIVFEFVAVLNFETTGEPLKVTLVSSKNILPQITGVTVPDTLPSGFTGTLTFSATVFDSNGIKDIKTVLFKGKRDNQTLFQGELLTTANAGVFEKSFDNTFAIGKKGVYELIFEAIDKSNRKSSPYSSSVFIGNNAPVLSDIQAPSAIPRPTDADVTLYFLITVQVRDDQSLKDIKFVKMSWKKADGTYSLNSPFQLYDNGLPIQEDLVGWDNGYRGDVVANDGIFSITGAFDIHQPLGNYELVFWAEDMAGNTSETLKHIINLQ